MLILYDFGLSPFAQKVKLALREKGIPFERRNGFAAEHRSDLAKGSARREIPMLIDGDAVIADSTIIVDYIEDKWPDPPLLPSDPVERARNRTIEELCDTDLEALNYCLGEMFFIQTEHADVQKAVQAYAAKDIKRLHGELESHLGDRPYFGGDTISRADISAVPHVNAARIMKLGPESPGLLAWLDRMNARETVAQTVQEVKESLNDFKALMGDVQAGRDRRQFRDHRLDWFLRAGGAPIIMERIQAGNVRFAV